MKQLRILLSAAAAALLLPAAGPAQSRAPHAAAGQFDLSGALLQKPQYFAMVSRLTEFSLDGSRLSTDTYRLHLAYEPDTSSGHTGFVYRCHGFSLCRGDSVTRQIPSLKGWTHVPHPEGYDENGLIFGIDHAIFDGIRDSEGQELSFDQAYHVYNTFIDFHGLCTVFAQPAGDGSGVQDLTKPGEKIVHAASFSRPPTNLGSRILKGSFFQNGEITLAFKGLADIRGGSCALLGYDSGESSFKMILEPFPEMRVTAAGRSRYRGDIYKSLSDYWVQRADLTEIVISATAAPMLPEKIYSVVEREIVIENIDEEAFFAKLD